MTRGGALARGEWRVRAGEGRGSGGPLARGHLTRPPLPSPAPLPCSVKQFENPANPAAHVATTAEEILAQVPELDAFAELGSRDFTICKCAARGAVILPVSSLVRPRRIVSVPTDQLPLDWQGEADQAGRLRSPV